MNVPRPDLRTRLGGRRPTVYAALVCSSAAALLLVFSTLRVFADMPGAMDYVGGLFPEDPPFTVAFLLVGVLRYGIVLSSLLEAAMAVAVVGLTVNGGRDMYSACSVLACCAAVLHGTWMLGFNPQVPTIDYVLRIVAVVLCLMTAVLLIVSAARTAPIGPVAGPGRLR
jgi:hypothetical protein